MGLLRICLIVTALIPATIAQGYFERTYTEADGLPHQGIVDIEQTADGLLWFSTMAGLATYDGHSFTPVVVDEQARLWTRYQIATDDHGDLWTFDVKPPFEGRLRIDGSWQPLPANHLIDPATCPAHLTVACVAQRNGEHFALLGSSGGHLLLLSAAGWRRVPLQTRVVRSICVLGDDFIIAHGRGVHVLPITSPDAEPAPIAKLPDHSALAVAFDASRNSCWIVGRTWIGEYRQGSFNLVLPSMKDPFFPDIISIALLPDERGGIYFGERAGCLHWTPIDGLEEFERINALDEIGITQMWRDREGIIWAGGVRGVAKFAGRSLVNRSSRQGLVEDEVSAILQLRDGRMVLGHDMHITVLDNPPRSKSLGHAATSTRIMSMVEDKDGSILAAASHAGLLRVNPDTLTFRPIPGPDIPTSMGSRPDRSVQSVSKATNGDIIVAGWRCAWRLKGGVAELIDIGSLPKGGSYIRQIVADGDHLLCAMRNAGVVQFCGQTMRQWTAESHSMQNVTCVARRPDGTIWAGSASGLLEATDDGTLRHRDFNGDQLTRPVYSITDDHRGRTWFGTNNGVTIWDGKRLRDITSDKGLAGRETNRGANVCDTDGRVWVGFDRGLTTFYPDRESTPRHGPTVEFLQPHVDGVATTDDSWQRLDNHRSIAFQLRSISTRDEEHLLHEYRLEGIDEDWSPKRALAGNQILYHSLPVGRYRLHVRATDSVGLSFTAMSPWIEVMPPWWQSWWFVLAVAAAAIALVGGTTLYASQRRNTHLLRRTVTERTANLTTERNRLQAMLTSIADGVIGIDKEGVIRVWNPTAARLTGWTEADAIGTRLDALLPPFDNPTSGTGQPVQVQIEDGTTRWFEFTIASVANRADSGQVIAFRDVTYRRQQERLLTRTERLESLGILAGGIAHDFNNLLTVMLGNLSLLELDEGVPNDSVDESEQLHEEIRDAVLRARDLTQQLLTFSKGGAPVRKPGSLAAVVIESTQLALSGANVRSQISIAEDLHDAEFDFGQVSQVIHNLVLNARQAMPQGGTVVVRGYNVDCSPQGTMASYAVIEIRDDGPGIPASELEHIFDPYYSTKPDGTGLGLATSYSIIQRHDGFLTAESHLGRGTVLRIHLPAAAPKTDAAHPSLKLSTPTQKTPRNQHVLCMDDDRAIRSVMVASMQSLGHRVTVVADGEAAIAAYQDAIHSDDPFDCVLLDLTVPGGMGGLETLAQLQKLTPDVAAIATTGYSTEPVRAEFHQLGFRAMLSKPFGVHDVDVALGKATRASARQAHRES